MDKIMATKRIKDLTTTATALDLVSSRYGVIDTPDITKKLPGNLLIGSGSGGGGLFQFVPGTTTFSDILPALEEGKMFVLVHELPSGDLRKLLHWSDKQYAEQREPHRAR